MLKKIVVRVGGGGSKLDVNKGKSNSKRFFKNHKLKS
jgi:hypothetical protein